MKVGTQRNEALWPTLRRSVANLIDSFDQISVERKKELAAFADLITSSTSEKITIIFVCTHNSRRSHVTMIWAHLAAYLFGRDKVSTYSGGTEVTAFNARAIAALDRVGFSIKVFAGENPKVEIGFGDHLPTLSCFSKRVGDETNPQEGYLAIMTCAHADANCPVLPRALHRFPLRYTDPGYADDTVQEASAYDQLVDQVGREMLYVFGLTT